MATEYPPLGKSYVISYSNGDKDFPIIAIKKDPRVDNYRRPDDLSPHPDSTRYPNHVFTGTQPTNTDERVIWIYEILPSPWTPFTRYDDDLGPVQGRRRSVANTGQEASLERDKRVSYEAREGSAIVSTELEESWDAGSLDPDKPSPFPIRDRDFYDEKLGPVQERRQLISATGNEKASLTYDAPIVTQIDYEPYNEFLVFKIVRTYTLAGPIRNENVYDPSRGNISKISQAIFDDKNHQASLTEIGGVVTQTSFQAINTLVVDKIIEKYTLNGPLLVGKATDGDKQIATVTTQRKAAAGYTPPELTATTSVEASREDAATIVERITEIPEVFSAIQVQSSKPDLIPEKFKVTMPDVEIAQNLAGQASVPPLDTNDISAAASQQDKFVFRLSKRSREIERKEITSIQFTSELGGGEAEVKEILIPKDSPEEEIDLDLGLISARVEDLGNGTRIKEVVKLKNQGELPELEGQEYDEALDIVIPYSQRAVDATNEDEITGERKEVVPRDVIHSTIKKYDFESIKNKLESFILVLPDMVQIKLPDILIGNPIVAWGVANAGSTGSGVGDSFTYSVSSSSSRNGTLTYNIQQGFSGTIPAQRIVIFLNGKDINGNIIPLTSNSVLTKINQLLGNTIPEYSIKMYPNISPESHTITILGSRIEESESQSVSYSGASSTSSNSYSVTVEQATIPPTIHSEVSIAEETASLTVTSSIQPTNTQVKGRYFPKSFPPTLNTVNGSFPTGKFLYSINSSPFRFGFLRIEAIVVEIKEEYTKIREIDFPAFSTT